MLTSENVSGLLGNSRYPADRPIPESWSRGHGQELCALVYSPAQLVWHSETCRSHWKHQAEQNEPLHTSSKSTEVGKWIAEELFEKVDKGIINYEEYMLEKVSLIDRCETKMCYKCLKTQLCCRVSIQYNPQEMIFKIYWHSHGQWVKHVTKRIVVWF